VPATLTQLVEARRLASELHVQFTNASEASQRAVLADTDDASAAAAEEARRARGLVGREMEALEGILQSLGYADDIRALNSFKERFGEYQRLDDEILELAVENTNVKAQRLSFGSGREAAEVVRASLNAVVRSAPSRDRWHIEALAARARGAVLEIQALQAPHIAEATDAQMTKLEGEMTAAAESARQSIEELKVTAGASAAPHIAAAATGLDRFLAINTEIIRLSRRNTDVRSLALSLGKKRTVTAQTEDGLRALEQALAKHEFTATR
jgi:hypothetical protein